MYLKPLILVGVGGVILIKKVLDIFEFNKVEEDSQSGTSNPSSSSSNPAPSSSSPPPPPSYSTATASSFSPPPPSPSPSYPKPTASSSSTSSLSPRPQPPSPSPSYPKPAASSSSSKSTSSFSLRPPSSPSSPKPSSSFSPSPSYPKPTSSPLPPSPSYHKPTSFSPPPPLPSYPKPTASSSSTSSFSPRPAPPSPSYPKPATSSSSSSKSFSSSSTSSFSLWPPSSSSSPKLPSSFSPSPSYPKPTPSPPSPSPSPSPLYAKPAASSFSRSNSSSSKPTLFPAPPSSRSKNQQNKTNYIWVEKGAKTTPLYVIPEDIKPLLEKEIVPAILKKPLSPSTYKDYFDALLYAEDYYLEKWDGFEMKSVSLELHEASIYSRKGKFKNINVDSEKYDKIFVAFEIDKIPERLPFLLSRDFASARPSGSKAEPFQGIIYRVLRSRLVLVEFGEDFHSQHYSGCKYDVKFSFNRVCLKRAHQAIAAASDPLLQNFIFPDCVPTNRLTASRLLSIDHKVDRKQVSAVLQMLSFHGPPPYLVDGPISVTMSKDSKQLSRTGMVVREAVLQIYRTFRVCRILICAPINSTCDVLMRSLRNDIPESSMFRANAAFRELDGVPLDILPSCLYKGECFSCPSLRELQEFKVILSTFMSSMQLRNEGIMAGHFSHIFLVDASSATEPETMVALANLANERTTVVVTGAPNNHSGWIRSSIARQYGLRTSYFQRLRESNLYRSLDPTLVTQLAD